MKKFKTTIQWIALAGGALGMFLGHLDAHADAVAVSGAILAGCALIALAVDRES